MSSVFANEGGGSGLRLANSPLDFDATERERQFRDWLLRDVLGAQSYKDFATWLKDLLVVLGFEVPISQIQGFAGFRPTVATPVLTQETTTSTSYTDLATVGPAIAGLADGVYEIKFGASAANAGTGIASRMSVSVNGGAASDNDCTLSGGVANHNSADSRVVVKTLQNDNNNTITAKYRSGNAAGTAFFQNRWLVATRVANA